MAKKRRINQVTTRAGDSGETRLATAKAVSKSDPVVRAMGSVDELNSAVGLLLAHCDRWQDELRQIQQDLFDIGAVLAMEGQYDAPSLDQLEALTQQLNDALPPLTEFILPGGSPACAHSHMCRAICRRAESDVWGYIKQADQPDGIIPAAQYLNRASDFFFVLARTLDTNDEQQWQGPNTA